MLLEGLLIAALACMTWVGIVFFLFPIETRYDRSQDPDAET